MIKEYPPQLLSRLMQQREMTPFVVDAKFS